MQCVLSFSALEFVSSCLQLGPRLMKMRDPSLKGDSLYVYYCVCWKIDKIKQQSVSGILKNDVTFGQLFTRSDNALVLTEVYLCFKC